MTLRTFSFNKLIRDKMYQSIIDNGAHLNLRKISSREELINCFKNKLLEEVQEVVEAQNDVDLLEELTDCVEVINGFLKALDISQDRFEEVKKCKYDERGGFSTPVMVESISISSVYTNADYYKFIIKYCLSSSLKYPEITNYSSKKEEIS